MKYLATPITALIVFLIPYLLTPLLVLGVTVVHSWPWLLIIIPGWWLLMVFGVGLTTVIPVMFQFIINRLYNGQIISVAIHSLAGFAGIFATIYDYYLHPPVVLDGGNETFFLSYLWEDSPLKLIVISIPFLIMLYNLTIAIAFGPWLLRNFDSSESK